MIVKKLWIVILVVLGFVIPGVVFNNNASATNSKEYQIYPTPQEIVYKNGEYNINENINIIAGDLIDEATKDFAIEVFGAIGTATISEGEVQDATNVYLATTLAANDETTLYIKDTYGNDYKGLDFNKIDAHTVISKDNEIAVLGNSSNAVYYGISSLKHIFTQLEENNGIRNFTIMDYADTISRGMIEGFYGLEWTTQDRQSILEFGADYKLNTYVYAPKYDVYHSAQWREPYPQEKLDEIKKLAEAGNASKMRFVWTIHPFIDNPFNVNKFDEEIALLKAKFEQLYEIGIRQFGILYDDAKNVGRANVLNVVNIMDDWCKEKSTPEDPIYPLIFCPDVFNGRSAKPADLNQIDNTLHKDIQVFWTGNWVMAPVDQQTLNQFRRNGAAEGVTRRSPLFWLNWPVNDYQKSRLLLGNPGELLKTDINPEDLTGVLTNPLEESETSKFALFQTADYAWNVKDFNAEKSWEDSFEYVALGIGKDLFAIAQHMSDPYPNWQNWALPESTNIKPTIDECIELIELGEDINEYAIDIKAEMDLIISSVSNILAYEGNEKLVSEMTPFIKSLSDLACAINSYLDAYNYLELGDNSNAKKALLNGNIYYSTSKDYITYSLDKYLPQIVKVEAGTKVLVPFAETVRDSVQSRINTNSDFKITPNVKMSSGIGTVDGNIKNICDGNDNTYYWIKSQVKQNDEIVLNFSEARKIYGLHISLGIKDHMADKFITGQFMYKTSGSDEWKTIGDEYNNQNDVHLQGLELENVIAVKYVEKSNSTTGRWLAIREFKVDFEPQQTIVKTGNNVFVPYTEGGKTYGEELMQDGDLSTYTHYATRARNNGFGPDVQDHVKVGDYIGYNFGEPIVLGKINFHQGKSAEGNPDAFPKYDVEYSIDGREWKKIDTDQTTKDYTKVFSGEDILAKYVRIVNKEDAHNWLAIREFKVEPKVSAGNIITNVEGLTLDTTYIDSTIEILKKDGITLEKDQYFGINLENNIYINSIITDIVNSENRNKIDLSIETSLDGITYTAYNADEKTLARYIRFINKTDSTIKCNLNSIKISEYNYDDIHIESQNGYNITNPAGISALFDGNTLTPYKFEGSQKKGTYVIIDLGRVINLTEFRVHSLDKEKDFPRAGKFSYSLTNNNDYKDLLILGDAEKPLEGEANDTDNVNQVFPDFSNATTWSKGVKDINVQARYLKFEITRDKQGSDKWVQFSEIELNGGMYLGDLNPKFTGDIEETSKTNVLDNMLDNNANTSFIPAKANGSLKYYVNNTDASVAKNIVITHNNNRNADLNVILGGIKNNQFTTIDLGKASGLINTFNIEDGFKLQTIELKWTTNIPEIFDITIKNAEESKVNYEALQELVNSEVDTKDWVVSAKEEYTRLIAEANRIISANNVTQAEVDSLVGQINNLVLRPQFKATELDRFNELINKKLEEKLYTSSSWANYIEILNKAKSEDIDDLTQTEVNEYVNSIELAIKSLVKLADTSLLQDLVDKQEDTSTWTTSSKNLYDSLINEAKALLETELTEDNQVKIDELVAKINSAIENHETKGDTTKLDELLNEQLDSNKYTEESWAKYQETINAAKEADTSDMTQDEIDALVNAIKAAKGALVDKPVDPVDPTEPEDGNGELSGGAIAGIVIGSIAGIALLGGAIYFVMRKRNNK